MRKIRFERKREMAEIAVSIVLDKLVPLLGQKLELKEDVGEELGSIKVELERIQPSLRDADGKAEITDSVKVWVKQVREAAHRLEDVLDEYEFRLLERADQQRCFGFLRKTACLIKKSDWRHEFAIEIQDISGTFIKIRERRDRYALNFLEEAGSSFANKGAAGHDPRQESLFIEESESVAIEEPKCRLINELLAEESKRTAISLLGMGGLGKTTLAQIVFNNQRVKGKFECRAWIAVSQSYNMVELLRTMLKQFYVGRKESPPEGIDAMYQKRLIHELGEFLLQKRYLVVFDDVWEIDFLESMEHALPKNEKCSRIVITTRKSDVASYCVRSSTHVIELQPLSQEEAWKLFCKKAFKSDLDGCCPPELEEVSLDIVKKCQGLPLAIVLIGGVLSRKNKVASQWRMFNDNLRSELENNPQLASITKILSLSYYDLPYYLKSCFLYFGMFPEDYSVRRGRLIRLWIAEGFVKEAADKTVEEVADDYLNELIHRSLVKVSEVFFDGRVRTCLIHDMLREFILQKLNELSFCQVFSKQEETSFSGSIRRLSIYKSEVNVPEITGLPKLRSVCMFGENELPKHFPNALSKSFKLLKILDFQDAPIRSVPNEVGNLFHLRFLSVRDTKVSMLPKSIGKLQNLETLELRGTNMNQLPSEILGIHKLRHIFVGSTSLGVKVPEGIGSLEALQHLCYVDANHGGDGLVRDLRKLKQMRRLGIIDLKKEDGEALCTAVENMRHLCSLYVCSTNGMIETLDLQYISSPPPDLQRLYLKGRLEKLPDWIPKLQNLTKIRFVMAKLLDDPLNVLRALPKLVELWIEDGYDGEQLHFEATGFQKLKILRIHELERLTRLKWVMIDEGALPLLQELKIERHIQLIEGCPGELQQRNIRIW